LACINGPCIIGKFGYSLKDWSSDSQASPIHLDILVKEAIQNLIKGRKIFIAKFGHSLRMQTSVFNSEDSESTVAGADIPGENHRYNSW
jgi:hypothetical protein